MALFSYATNHVLDNFVFKLKVFWYMFMQFASLFYFSPVSWKLVKNKIMKQTTDNPTLRALTD